MPTTPFNDGGKLCEARQHDCFFEHRHHASLAISAKTPVPFKLTGTHVDSLGFRQLSIDEFPFRTNIWGCLYCHPPISTLVTASRIASARASGLKAASDAYCRRPWLRGPRSDLLVKLSLNFLEWPVPTFVIAP